MSPPRKQVPPGTRNARTGAYVRKPVPVKGGKGGKKKDTCVCMVLAFAGGLGFIAVRAVQPVVDVWGVLS